MHRHAGCHCAVLSAGLGLVHPASRRAHCQLLFRTCCRSAMRGPPGEGLRSRPCRPAGPQRQGPHCRLRARLGAPEQAAAPAQGPDHPRLPGRPGARCCGASTTAAPAAASRSYETIAAKAECCRCTVAEALKALEWAGVLTWQNRITRDRGASAVTCSAAGRTAGR